jgi:hypothetical protein
MPEGPPARTPHFAPDRSHPPAETPVGTTVRGSYSHGGVFLGHLDVGWPFVSRVHEQNRNSPRRLVRQAADLPSGLAACNWAGAPLYAHPPSSLAQVVILAVIPTGPTASNQTALTRISFGPILPPIAPRRRSAPCRSLRPTTAAPQHGEPDRGVGGRLPRTSQHRDRAKHLGTRPLLVRGGRASRSTAARSWQPYPIVRGLLRPAAWHRHARRG